jgi:hypothetical protein
VPLRTWFYGPGTHPIKVEIFSPSEAVAPKPFSVTFKDVLYQPEDRDLRWLSNHSYYIKSENDFRNFTVGYGRANPWSFDER